MEKKKIILLEHRPYYRSVYGLNLNLYLGLEVLVAMTTKEVLDFLKSGPIALIFIDTRGYGRDIANSIFQEAEVIEKSIPLYVVGRTSISESLCHIFEPTVRIKFILQAMAKSLGVSAKSMSEFIKTEYFPLPMQFLSAGWYCSVALYRFEVGKYKKVVDIDQVITEEFLDSLEGSGIDQLYLVSNERLMFVNALTSQISSKLNDPNLSDEDKMKVTATAHQMVMEQARSIGISESTMDLANQCIENMIHVANSTPKLEMLVKNLMNQQNTYQYKHAFLISYIGSHIIKKMPWSSKEQQKNFSFVAFFHDISLTKDSYVKVRTDRELEQGDFSEKEKDLISRHAINSAKIVASYDKIPFGVDTLIKQHHGSKKGIGLSKINLNISPMAIVFILAEEWANIVLDADNKETRPDKKAVVGKLTSKYDNPSFQKVTHFLNELEF